MGVMEKNELLHELRIDRSADAPASKRPLLIGLALAVLLIGGGAAWLLGGDAAAPVKVAAARSLASVPAQASVLDATGFVTARRLATVSAKVTGKVREVLIEEGMRVEEGQVLATLDDTEVEAQLALTRAQLESARSQLAEIRAQLANAEREHERQQGMAARRLTSASALDAAQTQAEALRARLASQERAVAVAAEAVRVEQVQLDNTIIRAPFAGVVTVKAAQPGEMISPISAGGGFTRTGIGTIVDMDSLEVQVDVNEAFINRVRAEQPVEAVLNAYPDWKIPGHVIAIIPTADRARATVKVRIALEQRDGRLVPDMGVRVAFLEAAPPPTAAAPARSGVLVPATAVREDGGRSVIYVVRDGKALRRPVTAGGSIGEAREIKAGISAGEQVVIEGPADLRDGQAVTVDGA
jgi:RND family efflux transporter MFP subunit